MTIALNEHEIETSSPIEGDSKSTPSLLPNLPEPRITHKPLGRGDREKGVVRCAAAPLTPLLRDPHTKIPRSRSEVAKAVHSGLGALV